MNESGLCLLFTAGNERLAIPARDVFKIIDQPRVTRLPRLPSSLVGIAHHRGRIVTVVDTAALLHLGGEIPRPFARHALVLDRGQRQIALAVDGVDRVESIGALASNAQTGHPALQLASRNGAPILVVDADELFRSIAARRVD